MTKQSRPRPRKRAYAIRPYKAVPPKNDYSVFKERVWLLVAGSSLLKDNNQDQGAKNRAFHICTNMRISFEKELITDYTDYTEKI